MQNSLYQALLEPHSPPGGAYRLEWQRSGRPVCGLP